jgi:hypothetical protein
MLDFGILAFVDTYPSVCSHLFHRIPLSRDPPRFIYLALSLFSEEAFWSRWLESNTLYDFPLAIRIKSATVTI